DPRPPILGLVARFGDTDRPGIYEMSIDLEGEVRREVFAVNPDPVEGDLAALWPPGASDARREDALAAALGSRAGFTVQSDAAAGGSGGGRKNATDLWRPALFLLSGLFVVELLAGARASRRAA
ncbi:MAG: hypothetical protein HY719_12125, partial [Planctomycetes bacterium]|nr:hypothetical protein [Planctomycetota bacterium]